MKRFMLIAMLLFVVGCTNDEATNDAKDLVDDAERGVEDMIDDTERGVEDAGDAFTNDGNDARGDGTGPITDSPNDGNVNGDGSGNINGGGAGYDGTNDNESVEERTTNDEQLQKKK